MPGHDKRAIQNTGRTGYCIFNREESMAEEDPNQDKIEKFEVSDGKEPGSYEIYIKTKSEEFDFLIDGDSLQKLGDQIYAAIDKNEGKQ